MSDHPEPNAGKSLAVIARSALTVAAMTAPLMAATLPASAQLAFSADCRIFQQIAVAAPNNAILFSKHPVPHPAGTATVFDIDSLANHVIPAASNSCVLNPAPANDTYCFQARDDATILQVGAQPIQDPGGLTACQ